MHPVWINAKVTLGLFFFNATATTEIYTLSLHDALPICLPEFGCLSQGLPNGTGCPFVVSPKRLSTRFVGQPTLAAAGSQPAPTGSDDPHMAEKAAWKGDR